MRLAGQAACAVLVKGVPVQHTAAICFNHGILHTQSSHLVKHMSALSIQVYTSLSIFVYEGLMYESTCGS